MVKHQQDARLRLDGHQNRGDPKRWSLPGRLRLKMSKRSIILIFGGSFEQLKHVGPLELSPKPDRMDGAIPIVPLMMLIEICKSGCGR